MKTSDYRSLPSQTRIPSTAPNIPALVASAILFSLMLFAFGCTKDGSLAEMRNKEKPASLKVRLVGHWDFLGNANDLSESGFHGAVIGATPTKDRHGRENAAFTFNGTSDHITLGNVEELSFGGFQPYTITSWVRPDTAGVSNLDLGKTLLVCYGARV